MNTESPFAGLPAPTEVTFKNLDRYKQLALDGLSGNLTDEDKVFYQPKVLARLLLNVINLVQST